MPSPLIRTGVAGIDVLDDRRRQELGRVGAIWALRQCDRDLGSVSGDDHECGRCGRLSAAVGPALRAPALERRRALTPAFTTECQQRRLCGAAQSGNAP